MADTKISALPDAATAVSGDEIPVNRTGTTKKITVGYIRTLFDTIYQAIGTYVTSVGATAPIASSGGTTPTISLNDNGVTYAKLQDVTATNRILGRATAGAGDPEEITVGGDISQSGSNFNIGNDKVITVKILDKNVTYAKIQDISATSRVLGRITAGAGVTEELTGANVRTIAQVGTNEIGIAFIIDGGGATITTGVKGFLEIPFAMTITGWTILGDQSGSIVVDVWKDTYANFPPTVADTIAGAEKPTISAATKGQDLSLSTWTTAVSTGDVLGFNVDSITTLQRVTLVIRGTKS